MMAAHLYWQLAPRRNRELASIDTDATDMDPEEEDAPETGLEGPRRFLGLAF